MDNLSQKINSLMAAWAQRHREMGWKNFISDGAVNPTVYENSHPKIVFFLKEAYSKTDADWCLTEWLNSGAMTRMWGAVAEWIYGMKHTTTTDIPPKPQLTQEEKTALLQTAAIVNVKKSNGTSNSDYTDLLQYAQADLEYLKQELELLAPDIIVCGNNSSLLRAVYGAKIQDGNVSSGGEIVAERMRTNGFALVGDQIIIDYYHPANHYPAILNYYTVCSLYQQALKTKSEK